MPADPRQSPALAFQRVAFRYPGRDGWTLRDVSFDLPTGSVTALVGPNGAGKTTLFRLALGFAEPAEGAVSLHNRDIRTVRAAVRAKTMAYVPQRPELAFGFTAAEAVTLGNTAHRSVATDALEAVGLHDRASDAFTALSAGQQQRVTLARALAQIGVFDHHADLSGRILLADEPLAAQDPAHALRAGEAIRAAAARGAAALVAVHDLGAAARLADRVLVLDAGGQLAASGEPSEALADDVLERVFGVRFARAFDDAGRPLAITGVNHADGR